MIEIDIGKLIASVVYLKTFVREYHERAEIDIPPATRKIFATACDELVEYVQSCDLKASNRALSRLIGNIEAEDEEFTFADFQRFAEDFLLRLRDEFELTTFLFVEASRLKFYDTSEPLFGTEVASKYPSAYQEIAEAGKCLALGRSTACVFHLMRTMEVGIHAVAQGLKIPDPAKPAEKNWGVILRKIREAIDARQRWRRKSDKDFYEEAWASLDAVRNPWAECHYACREDVHRRRSGKHPLHREGLYEQVGFEDRRER